MMHGISQFKESNAVQYLGNLNLHFEESFMPDGTYQEGFVSSKQFVTSF